VSRFKVGDRVLTTFFPNWLGGRIPVKREHYMGEHDGWLAEYRVVNAEILSLLPDHLSFEEGSTLPCAALTAWQALAGVGPGDTVLTLGTGGVSIFSLQFAKMAGARVILTSSSDEKLERARALGADHVINYRRQPEWQNAVLEFTDGKGADHVVEVGGPDTLNRTLQAVRVGGSISLMGVLTGFTANLSTVSILHKNIKIQGTYVGSVAMFEAMNRAIALHRMKPVVDRVFSFDDAVAALKYLQSGNHFGKVVITL